MPACMISPGSASLTLICAISLSCWLNCVVKLAGICCTSKTAPGKSFGNCGTNFINVEGPPVEAAITTIGNFPLIVPNVLVGAEVDGTSESGSDAAFGLE